MLIWQVLLKLRLKLLRMEANLEFDYSKLHLKLLQMDANLEFRRSPQQNTPEKANILPTQRLNINPRICVILRRPISAQCRCQIKLSSDSIHLETNARLTKWLGFYSLRSCQDRNKR